MNSIVIELQRDAVGGGGSNADLLRKSLLVAKKLRIHEMEKWLNDEMNGYADEADVPKYRWVGGAIKALNPIRGWIPAQFQDLSIRKRLSKWPLYSSVGEIESIIKNNQEQGAVMLAYPDAIQHTFIRDTPMAAIGIEVPLSSVEGILESVRNFVLRWALQLEADGILGEGFTFSHDERERAAEQHYSINNFYGSVANSQIQQNTSNSSQRLVASAETSNLVAIVEALRGIRGSLDTSAEGAELESEIKTLEAQITSPRPKKAIVREALGSARKILESAAGRLVGEAALRSGGVVEAINQVLRHL